MKFIHFWGIFIVIIITVKMNLDWIVRPSVILLLWKEQGTEICCFCDWMFGIKIKNNKLRCACHDWLNYILILSYTHGQPTETQSANLYMYIVNIDNWYSILFSSDTREWLPGLSSEEGIWRMVSNNQCLLEKWIPHQWNMISKNSIITEKI